VLQPLKIPSHITPTNAKKIVVGDIREGVIVTVKGKKFVDVGINQLIQFYGKTSTGKRITIQFKENQNLNHIGDIMLKKDLIYFHYYLNGKVM